MKRDDRGRFFKPYRSAGFAFIKEMKMRNGGKDPCVAIRPADPEWGPWVTFLRGQFDGRLPWEFDACAETKLPTVTVPCRDFNEFTGYLLKEMQLEGR